MSYLALSVPRTGLEPARLSPLAPETSASTIPPPGLLLGKVTEFFWFLQIFEGVFAFFLRFRGGSAHFWAGLGVLRASELVFWQVSGRFNSFFWAVLPILWGVVRILFVILGRSGGVLIVLLSLLTSTGL